MRQLLVLVRPQSLNWRHPRGARGRQPRSHKSDHEQQSKSRGHRHWIAGLEPVQQSPDEWPRQQARNGTDDQTAHYGPCRLPYDETTHIGRAGTKGKTDRNLTGAPGNAVGGDAIDADRGEQPRQHTKADREP